MFEGVIAIVALVSFILLAVLAIAHIYLYYGLIKKLKILYPETWDKLGQPKSVIKGTIQSHNDFWKYIKASEYKELNDNDVNRKALLLKKINVFYLVLFFIAFFGFAAIFILKNN